jgi:periplasmic protein TonB
MRTFTLPLLTASSVGLFASGSPVHAACDPTVIQSPTKFPIQSQLRGQKGIVLLEVIVDRSGRASATQLLRSSGYKRLDQAAAASIREQWVFDVTSCEREDLPASNLITVEYRNDEYAK